MEMKTKVLALIFLSFLLSGCGITHGHYNAETRELDFWMGKEYDSFVLYYKKDGEEIFIQAKKVAAFKGQQLIKEGLVDAVKEGVKAAIPIP